MLVYAGIDEAGYGPMLGPLCVGASVFVLNGVDAEDGAPNLWALLKNAVCRRKKDGRRRIAVDDSKRLKGANGAPGPHPLKHLERAVLAFHSAQTNRTTAFDLPPDDDHLFNDLGATVGDQPWYDSTTPLPLAHETDQVRIDVSRLRRTLERADVTLEVLACGAIDAATLNRDVDRLGTKADVNLRAALRYVAAIWRRWPEAHPRIIIDRHGGRTHYDEAIEATFPEAIVEIVAERDTVSRYRLDRDGSRITVSFVTESERQHLPVALASMTAKYVRELMMLRLNRFFRGHLPELRPTAGYVQDARRYLGDIDPVVRSLGVTRDTLVRSV